MKWMITGAAGFIGSNFLYTMMKKHPSYDFIALDKLTYAGHFPTIAPLEKENNFRFIQGDIADSIEMHKVFQKEKPDMVINFAAESHVDRSIENPSLFIQTNVLGTQVLLDACKTYGVTRFHQVSTDEVYGDLPLDRPDLLFTEETPLHGSSPYSASKAAADLLVQAYFRTYGLPVTISRCSNNYGPYHFPEKLIPLMITHCLRGKPLPVYGNGKNIRDWLYVTDHCQAIDLILHQGTVGEVYNIGGQAEKSNLEVVESIIRILGKGEITFVADRKGHDLRYAIDPSKMEQALGWRPEVSFEEGLKQTIAWYLDHEAWWAPLL